MRVLTVRQPWAEAIIFGGKDVENRPRNIAGRYRGHVAIHTALHKPSPAEWQSFESEYPQALSQMTHRVPWGQEEFGVIIGVVDLIGAHSWPCVGGDRTWKCSEWGFEDGWHLELTNPRPLREPIPFKGALGLRRLDDYTIARIQEGIAA